MKFSHGELAQMEQAAKNKADNTNRCVCCGKEIPEGRMVCPICENGRSKTKPRYIDANKLIESLGDSVDACKKWVRKMKARNDGEMIARSTQAEATLIEAILRTKAMPTADVVEVKHGEWKEIQRYEPTDKAAINECSVCHDTIWMYDGERGWNYCPNCGAKMDGGKDNDDQN